MLRVGIFASNAISRAGLLTLMQSTGVEIVAEVDELNAVQTLLELPMVDVIVLELPELNALTLQALEMTRRFKSRASSRWSSVISKKIGWPKRPPYPKYVANMLPKSSTCSPERKPIFDLAIVDTAIAKSSSNSTGSSSQHVSSTDSLQ